MTPRAWTGEAASKAAATSLTEALHQQLLKETQGRVRVAGLFPGPYVVNTGILASKKNRPDTFGGADAKAWKDIWGCGQGIGAVTQVQSTAAYVAQLKREYADAKAGLMARNYA